MIMQHAIASSHEVEPVKNGTALASTRATLRAQVYSATLRTSFAGVKVAAMENPSFAAVRDLELLVRDAGLLVTIVAVRANKSHVFVVDEPDADVELIDPVDNQLHVRPSHVAKLDSLPDLDVEAVRVLSGSRGGKQHADDDSQEYLSHFLGVAEQETRRNVKTRGLPRQLLTDT